MLPSQSCVLIITSLKFALLELTWAVFQDLVFFTASFLFLSHSHAHMAKCLACLEAPAWGHFPMCLLKAEEKQEGECRTVVYPALP